MSNLHEAAVKRLVGQRAARQADQVRKAKQVAGRARNSIEAEKSRNEQLAPANATASPKVDAPQNDQLEASDSLDETNATSKLPYAITPIDRGVMIGRIEVSSETIIQGPDRNQLTAEELARAILDAVSLESATHDPLDDLAELHYAPKS